MVKKIFILSILFLFSSDFVFALEPFVKSKKNPLNFSGNFENWNEVGQYQPSILFENGRYKLWYASYNGNNFKIVYANSIDGTSWEKIKLFDFNPQFDNHDPSILKINGKYKLFFVQSKNDKNYKIMEIDSIDGVDFDQSTLKTILTPTETWESFAVSAPNIIYKNNKYYLFYSGWNGSKWRLGLAISSDGNNWEKCSNNPLFPEGGNSSLIEEGGASYLFYHMGDASGIKYLSTTDDISCRTNWLQPLYAIQPSQPYDLHHIIGPALTENNKKFFLYYSGLSSDYKWKINLATSLKPKIPIVIIPGFMASWNKEAILHNQDVPFDQWKIPSFIKEYQGIEKSLTNIGLEENKDFFIFPYDWRKPISQIDTNLNTFINQKIWNNNPQTKINLLGHSLGGVVARTYAQDTPDKIKTLITVASPHLGVVQVYKPLEAGEISRENTFQWLAEKSILVLNKDGFQTDKQTIQTIFPVLYDLFPTFDFLKDEQNNLIAVDTLKIKNNFLSQYNQNTDNIGIFFSNLYGEKDGESTPRGFNVSSPTESDNLSGSYQDGHPQSTFNSQGDYLVPSLSSNGLNGASSASFPFDHGEMIYRKEVIKKIFDIFNLDYQDSQIVEGEKTIISPSLIFYIQSPATMEAMLNDKSFKEEDGVLFIPNADSNEYNLLVRGTGAGDYNIYIGQIAKNNDIWNKISGEITQSPPTSQTDKYKINYNNILAKNIYPSPTPTITPAPTLAPTLIPTPTLAPTSTPTPIEQETQNENSQQEMSLPLNSANQPNNQNKNKEENFAQETPSSNNYQKILAKNSLVSKPQILGEKIKKNTPTQISVKETKNNFKSIFIKILKIFFTSIIFIAIIFYLIRS